MYRYSLKRRPQVPAYIFSFDRNTLASNNALSIACCNWALSLANSSVIAFSTPVKLPVLKRQYPKLQLQFMSVHASKGKEADYVIVLGLEKGKNALLV